jgi:micrococcal nuclease
MIRVRLHGIVAPEHDQTDGKAAKRELSQLLYRKDVELVKRGAAWVYRRYATDTAWCAYEKQARDRDLGPWALPASNPCVA